MYKLTFAFLFLLLSLGNTHANDIISGSFGRNPNTLKIFQTEKGISLLGNFLGRHYAYQIVHNGPDYKIAGKLDNLNLNLALSPDMNEIEVDDEFSKTNVKLSINPYVNFISGRYLNYSASLRIEKSATEHHITGFLLNHLYDLYIKKNDEGFVFKGYSNGHWTNLQIKQIDTKIYSISGKFQNQEVDLKYSGTQLNISDLIELMIFKVHFPHIDLIQF